MSDIPSYTIDFDPIINDQLVELAQRKGEDPEKIIAQAVIAFIRFNTAFTEEVREGLNYLSQDDAKLFPHGEVMDTVRQHIKSKQVTL